MISEEQRNLVLQDFVTIFKETYGDEWMLKLSANLTPSPIPRIAAERGVKLYQVKQIRRQFKVVGHYIEVLKSLFEPIPVTLYTFEFNYELLNQQSSYQ
jgi:hypothetical protein